MNKGMILSKKRDSRIQDQRIAFKRQSKLRLIPFSLTQKIIQYFEINSAKEVKAVH